MNIKFISQLLALAIFMLSIQAESSSDAVTDFEFYLNDLIRVNDTTFSYQKIAEDSQLAISYFENTNEIDYRVVATFLDSPKLLTIEVVAYLHKHFDAFEAIFLRQKAKQLRESWSTDHQSRNFLSKFVAYITGEQSRKHLSRFFTYYVIDLIVSRIAVREVSASAVIRETAWEVAWKAAKVTGAYIVESNIRVATKAAVMDSARVAVKLAVQAVAESVWIATNEYASEATSEVARKTAELVADTKRPNEIEEMTYSLTALSVLNWALGEEAAELRNLAEKAACEKMKILDDQEVKAILAGIKGQLWDTPSIEWEGSLLRNHPQMQILKALFFP